MTLPGRPAVAAVAVGAAALTLGSLHADLRDYGRVATSLGDPQLTSFAQIVNDPTDGRVRETNTYDWSQRFFGTDSEWTRYSYSTDPSFARA